MITDVAVSLIERPVQRVDRLSALLDALAPSARLCPADNPAATLVVAGRGAPERVALRLDGAAPEPEALAAAFIATAAPLEAALGGAARLVVALDGAAELAALADLFVAEASGARCGRAAASARLAEALFALALRRAVDLRAAPAGLLAGLGHPRLHRALVAIHDAPERPWTVETLADVAGMSRSRFMAAFSAAMGQGPAAYLAGWRLQRARADLAAGRPVKEVARRAGYGSAAAFTRAFARLHGATPGRVAAAGRGPLTAAAQSSA